MKTGLTKMCRQLSTSGSLVILRRTQKFEYSRENEDSSSLQISTNYKEYDYLNTSFTLIFSKIVKKPNEQSGKMLS
jgi:hypothetical protein